MAHLGDSTMVTGSAVSGSGGPRRGEVLGERYEVQDCLGQDAFTFGYRAFDQETESAILLRIVRPRFLSTPSEARAAARRLSRIVGAGGKHLSPLLDADSEGCRLFVVEALSEGVTLRRVLDTRLARGERMEPAELLSIVARLAAGLAAIPAPWRHGDVRAERIRLGDETLLLEAPFLLSALPHRAVCAAIGEDARLCRAFAPEVLAGTAGDAADRFGVACVAFEALTGRTPEGGATVASALGDLGEILLRLLSSDPSRRPGSLEPLIEALAKRAELPVPAVAPGSYRQPRRLAIRRNADELPAAVQESDEMRSSDTEPTVQKHLRSARPDEDTRRHPALSTDGSETTRNVSATEARGAARVEEDRVVPRRRIPGAAAEGTLEIDASSILEEAPLASHDEEDEFDAEPTTPVGDRSPRRPPHPRTVELGPDDLVMVEQAVAPLPVWPQTVGLRRQGAPARPYPPLSRPPPPAAVHEPAPASAPPPASAAVMAEAAPASPAAPALAPPAAPALAPPVAPAPPSYEAQPPPRPTGMRPSTRLIKPQQGAAFSAASQRARGLWILLGAVLLGAAIIAAGAFIAHQRQKDAGREQRLKERFEQLQQLESASPD